MLKTRISLLLVVGVSFLVSLTARSEPPSPKEAAKEAHARTDLYGDPLPEGAIARLGSLRLRHYVCASYAQFSPDATKLITLDRWGEPLRVWDAKTGKQLYKFPGYGGRPDVGTVAVSPDSRTLAGTHHEDGTVCMWDLASGKQLGELGRKDRGSAQIGFSPDGKTIAYASEAIYLHSLRTLKELRRFEIKGQRLWPFAFSPDGKKIAAVAWQEIPRKEKPGARDLARRIEDEGPRYILSIRLWEVETAKERLSCPWTEKHTVRSIRFQADGKTLAIGDDEGIVHFLDIATLKEVRRLQLGGVWSADGRAVAARIEEGISIRDVTSGKEIRRLERLMQPIAFSPDGKVLAAVADYTPMYLCDLTTGQELLQLQGHGYSVAGIAFAPDGKTLVTGDAEGSIRFWESTTGREVAAPMKQEAGISCLTFSPDGKTLAAGGAAGTVTGWAISGRKQTFRCKTDRGEVGEIAFAADGRMVAVRDGRGETPIRTWDVIKGQSLMQFGGDEDRIARAGAVCFWSDGKTLVTLPYEDTAIFWDLHTGAEFARHEGPPEPRKTGYGCAAFAPDVRTWAGAGAYQRALLWDMLTGGQLLAIPLPDKGSAAMAYSPNNRLLVMAGGYETAVLSIWDIAKGRQLRQLEGFSSGVRSLAFSPDGRLLATGMINGEVLVWDLAALGIDTELPLKNLSPQEMEKLWTDLASRDKQGYWSVWDLAAGGNRAVKFLKDRLQPIPEADAQLVAQLIADLDSKDSSAREAALEELANLGARAEPAVRRAIAGRPSVEARARLGEFLTYVRRKTVLVPPGEPMRRVRAIHVLEIIGTPEAKEVLQTLAKGVPSAPQTMHAKAALVRLEKQPTAKP